MVTLPNKYVFRRAYSELNLLDITPQKFQNGECYNFITSGDVDAISFIKLIIRQQNIEYLLFSTWCMALDDCKQFEKWLQDGKIKKLDAYFGEIFKGSYRREYNEMKRIFETYKCGRIGIFRNHSKVFAGYGDKFHFGIQTSANINTNPRTENACIQINKEIFEFYKSYFDEIKSFE